MKKNMITIVMAYYENGGMLDKHLSEWESYPAEIKKQFKAIIVDDGSRDDPAIGHIREIGLPISVYRIKKDIPWNQNGARNLAMTYAEGWCLMTDMDHLLTAENAKVLAFKKLKPKYAYKPMRILANGSDKKRHPNTYVLHQKKYWEAGGYDERFCGYYGTDSTFRRQLKRICKFVLTDEIKVVLYGREVIPDASTRRYGRKGTEYHISHYPMIKKLRKQGLTPIPPLNFEWEKLL